MRIIDSLYNIDTELKGFILYFSHTLLFYLALKILFKMNIYFFEKIIICFFYFILMYLMFFDRVYIGERILNINPLDIISTIKNTGLLSTVLNVCIFIPFYTSIKWILNKIEFKEVLIIFLVFSIGGGNNPIHYYEWDF